MMDTGKLTSTLLLVIPSEDYVSITKRNLDDTYETRILYVSGSFIHKKRLYES